MCARGLLKTKSVCIYVLEGVAGEEKEGAYWWLNSFQFSASFLCHWAKTCRRYSSFLSSRPVRFVDDRISAGLNQAVALLNLAWPITAAGNVAQSMLQLTVLVLVDFSWLWLHWGDTVSDRFYGSFIAEGWALWHCVVAFGLCQVTFSLDYCKVLQKLNGSLCCSKYWRGKPTAICSHLCFRHGSGGNCCSRLL